MEVEWVENTTDVELPDYVERMLGPNFNVESEKRFPYIELVASIEKCVQTKENADEIRSEVTNAMINHSSSCSATTTTFTGRVDPERRHQVQKVPERKSEFGHHEGG